MNNAEKLAIAVLLSSPREVQELAIEELRKLQPPSRPSGGPLRIKQARPGSLRSALHNVLAVYGRIPRRRLIDEIARLRGDDPARLERPIDEALRTDDSGRIQRVRRGEYAYVA